MWTNRPFVNPDFRHSPYCVGAENWKLAWKWSFHTEKTKTSYVFGPHNAREIQKQSLVILGIVYTDTVSNRNGFMTWKPHRKRHGFKEFTRSLSNKCHTWPFIDLNISSIFTLIDFFIMFMDILKSQAFLSSHCCGGQKLSLFSNCHHKFPAFFSISAIHLSFFNFMIPCR